MSCSFGAHNHAVIADVRIPCHGEQLAAYVYRPSATQGDAPCVVMASGFSGHGTTGCPDTPRHSAMRDSSSSCLTTAISALRQVSRVS